MICVFANPTVDKELATNLYLKWNIVNVESFKLFLVVHEMLCLFYKSMLWYH
jgi:hypothetical protein